MIDTQTETLLTMKQAQAEFPNSPSLPTLRRWIANGVRGNVLESVLIGGRRFTSKEACLRFIDASPNASSSQRSQREQRQSLERAQAILDHFGI